MLSSDHIGKISSASTAMGFDACALFAPSIDRALQDCTDACKKHRHPGLNFHPPLVSATSLLLPLQDFITLELRMKMLRLPLFCVGGWAKRASHGDGDTLCILTGDRLFGRLIACRTSCSLASALGQVGTYRNQAHLNGWGI